MTTSHRTRGLQRPAPRCRWSRGGGAPAWCAAGLAAGPGQGGGSGLTGERRPRSPPAHRPWLQVGVPDGVLVRHGSGLMGGCGAVYPLLYPVVPSLYPVAKANGYRLSSGISGFLALCTRCTHYFHKVYRREVKSTASPIRGWSRWVQRVQNVTQAELSDKSPYPHCFPAGTGPPARQVFDGLISPDKSGESSPSRRCTHWTRPVGTEAARRSPSAHLRLPDQYADRAPDGVPPSARPILRPACSWLPRAP